MWWQKMLDDGRKLARLSPGPRSTDAVSRHEPALNHLGLAAQGEDRAPRATPARAPVPAPARMAAEPYRWTTPPPPPPGRPAGELAGSHPTGTEPAGRDPAWWSPAPPADGPDRNGPLPGSGRATTLGWLATLCAAATLAVVVALLCTGGGSVHTATSRQAPSSTTGPSHRGAGPFPSGAGQAGGASASPARGTPRSTRAPATPATPPASAPSAPPGAAAPPPPATPSGGAPVISSISPDSGPAGTAVTLTGRGFFSASGTIVVLFGQVQAPVRCPTQHTCVASAPPQASPSSPAVPGIVTTDGGRSAPVPFTYTGG